jgi:hypothetical protein
MFWKDEIMELLFQFKLLCQDFSGSTKNKTGMFTYDVNLKRVPVTIVAVEKQ